MRSQREGVWKRNEKLVYLANFLHMTLRPIKKGLMDPYGAL